MASTAVNSSSFFPQVLQHRNVSPDVPEDIDDHFNDPNWDYAPPSPATTTTFVEKRSSWTNSSVRTSDIENSSQYYGSSSGPSKLDLREAVIENE